MSVHYKHATCTILVTLQNWYHYHHEDQRLLCDLHLCSPPLTPDKAHRQKVALILVLFNTFFFLTTLFIVRSIITLHTLASSNYFQLLYDSVITNKHKTLPNHVDKLEE